MGAFEDVHRDRITGSLAMFDRMIFKGHLSRLYQQDGARCFLWSQGVALKDFTASAKATTERIANNARKLVTDEGRPVISFDHVKTRNRTQHKDELAKSIAERDGITEGIICLISAVETCFSFQVRKRRYESGKLELFRRERKCLHHYLYLIDDEFGFMHVRIQGWIPYECQIYLNGREWLARQLDKAGIGYVRYDNSLLAVDDLEAAAELCDRFAHKAWPRVLNAFARLLNPILPAIRAANYGGYYWVLDQAEIATDVMFQTRPQLLEVWPDLVRHAALNMSSEDVLGFLGRKLHPSLQAQVVTDTKRRPQGWRIFVGYRWYDANEVTPLFPFGHGLSYTSFQDSDVKVVPRSCRAAGRHGLRVSFRITNTGERAGADVAQVYVGPSPDTGVPQAVRALAGYEKVTVPAGRSRHVTITIPPEQLTHWDTTEHEWALGTGTRDVWVGGSSAHLPLHTTACIVDR